ncbi:MAG TPA: hypothetical protein VHR15_16900 [Ktedonobacterales bacterium]|jgi:hypothetical protein|nr:hypothetical protein [Ktedonobacterales bacterium]
MSAAGTPVCAEAIGDETLAFWRDGFLRDAATARRLDAHTPGCPSCQRRLAAMESFGAAMRRQRTPNPDPLLWRRLEARMVGGPGRASLLFGMNTRTFTAGAVVSAIGAVAAVALIAVSFLTLFSTIRPPGAPSDIFTRQASATATAAPSLTPSLDWRAGSFPADFATQPQQPTLAVAPSDGRIAYTCLLTSVSGGTRPAVWRTDDRAVTWTRVGALPITRSDLLSCALLLDEGEPAIAVASVSYGAFFAGVADHIAHFATYDRGLTWEPVADAEGTYYQKLITRQKIKFALRDISPRDQPDDIRLATSVDNMQSWQRIDKPLLARGLVVSDFWLDDVTGALVAMVRPKNSGNFPLQFWRSTDQGANWTLIGDQEADLGVASGGFARPTGSWSLCAITPVDNSAPLTVRCTADGGQTWSRFHRATAMMSPGDLSDELRLLIWQVVFKRDDGRFVIAVMDSERTMTLLLLDPVSGTWTALGQTATALLRYAPNAAGGAGILWAIPVGGQPGSWGANVQTTTVSHA